jgi:hypothetical protein
MQQARCMGAHAAAAARTRTGEACTPGSSGRDRRMDEACTAEGGQGVHARHPRHVPRRTHGVLAAWAWAAAALLLLLLLQRPDCIGGGGGCSGGVHAASGSQEHQQQERRLAAACVAMAEKVTQSPAFTTSLSPTSARQWAPCTFGLPHTPPTIASPLPHHNTQLNS